MVYLYHFFLPWGRPGKLTGVQGEWYRFGISFFSAGEGSCLVLETTSLDHGDMPTGFVRVLISGISL